MFMLLYFLHLQISGTAFNRLFLVYCEALSTPKLASACESDAGTFTSTSPGSGGAGSRYLEKFQTGNASLNAISHLRKRSGDEDDEDYEDDEHDIVLAGSDWEESIEMGKPIFDETTDWQLSEEIDEEQVYTEPQPREIESKYAVQFFNVENDLAAILMLTWTRMRDRTSNGHLLTEPPSSDLKFITVAPTYNPETVSIIKKAIAKVSALAKYWTFVAPDLDDPDEIKVTIWQALLGTLEIGQIQKSLNDYRRTFKFISISSIVAQLDESGERPAVIILATLTDPLEKRQSSPPNRYSPHSKVLVRLESESQSLTRFIGTDWFNESHGYRTFTPEFWPGPGVLRKGLYGPGAFVETYTKISVYWRRMTWELKNGVDLQGPCQLSVSVAEENIVLETIPTTDATILGDIIYEAWRLKSGRGGFRFLTFMYPSKTARDSLMEIYQAKRRKVDEHNSDPDRTSEQKPYLTIWASRWCWESYHELDEAVWDDEEIDTAAIYELDVTLELRALAHIFSDATRSRDLGSPYLVSIDIGLQSSSTSGPFAMLIRLGGNGLDEELQEGMRMAASRTGTEPEIPLHLAGDVDETSTPTPTPTSISDSEAEAVLISQTLDALITGINLRIKAISVQPLSAFDLARNQRAWEIHLAKYSPPQQRRESEKPKIVTNPARELMSEVIQADRVAYRPPSIPEEVTGDSSEIYEVIDIIDKRDNEAAASLAISTKHGHIVVLMAPEPNPQPRGAAKYIDFQFSSSLSRAWEAALSRQPKDQRQTHPPIQYVSILQVSTWTRDFLNRLRIHDQFRWRYEVRLKANLLFDPAYVGDSPFVDTDGQRTFLVLHGIPELAAIQDLAWRNHGKESIKEGIIDDILIRWDPDSEHNSPLIFVGLRPWPPRSLKDERIVDTVELVRAEMPEKVAARGLFLTEVMTYAPPLALFANVPINSEQLAIQDSQDLRWHAYPMVQLEKVVNPTRALKFVSGLLDMPVPAFNHPIQLHGPGFNGEKDILDSLVIQGTADPWSQSGRALYIGSVKNEDQPSKHLRETRQYMRDGPAGQSLEIGLDQRQQLMIQMYKAVFRSPTWKNVGFQAIVIHQLSPEAYEAYARLLSKGDQSGRDVDGAHLSYALPSRFSERFHPPFYDPDIISLLGIPEISALVYLGLADIKNRQFWFQPEEIVVTRCDDEIVLGIRLGYFSSADGSRVVGPIKYGDRV
ncbi:hypothetical protein TWF696_006727 [Orbilia brochopaga]|uniref:Heterokaryon incompatibility domain-containing protein n=1 Tax=Orbilia brochopaga TaxID=3140254 RepID=A0AAV9UQ43_9PEZI